APAETHSCPPYTCGVHQFLFASTLRELYVLRLHGMDVYLLVSCLPSGRTWVFSESDGNDRGRGTRCRLCRYSEWRSAVGSAARHGLEFPVRPGALSRHWGDRVAAVSHPCDASAVRYTKCDILNVVLLFVYQCDLGLYHGGFGV